MSDTVTSVDLFAGCGGASCGMMQAGIDVVAMVEYDCTAALTYAVNLCRYGEMQFHFITAEDEQRMEHECAKAVKGQNDFRAGSGWIRSQSRRKVRGCRHVIIGDIRMLSGAVLLHWLGMKRGELGHMSMSPPCQGFSTANPNYHKMRRGLPHHDARNDLCFEAARLIVECHPQSLSLENVPGFAKSPQFQMFTDLLKGGPKALAVFEQLLPKHPHWTQLLRFGDVVQAFAAEFPGVKIV